MSSEDLFRPRTHRLGVTTCALAFVVASLTCECDARADDIVHLVSGGRVVGVVVEESPQSVRVLLANKEIKVIPRAQVTSIQFEGEAAPAPQAEPPPVVPVAPPPPSPPPPAPPPEPVAPPEPIPPSSPYEGGRQVKMFHLSRGWRALGTASFGGGVVLDRASTGFEVLVGGSAVVSPGFELDLGIAGRWQAVQDLGQATGLAARAGFAAVPAEVYALRLGLQLGGLALSDPSGGSLGAVTVEAKARPVEVRFGEERSVFLGLEATLGGWIAPETITIGVAGGSAVLGYRPRLGI